MESSLRIAVADDELDMRDYFKKSLSRLGHQVVTVAQNGRELIEQCKLQEPDLVITDLKMPDIDGMEAAVQIYQRRPVPVILVSAYHDPELIARAESDHVLSYIIKPVGQADLQMAIATTMHRFQESQNAAWSVARRHLLLQDSSYSNGISRASR
jgi:CheY-like chemotaxis protein